MKPWNRETRETQVCAKSCLYARMCQAYKIRSASLEIKKHLTRNGNPLNRKSAIKSRPTKFWQFFTLKFVKIENYSSNALETDELCPNFVVLLNFRELLTIKIVCLWNKYNFVVLFSVLLWSLARTKSLNLLCAFLHINLS